MGDLVEDGEVEPNCVWNQNWDLEGFFLNGTSLSIVGGYDFDIINQNFPSGDIFLDVDGDAEYGFSNTGNGGGIQTVPNIYGYDYVIDLDFGSYSYNVYYITAAPTVAVCYDQNKGSNPWRYVYDANNASITSGTIVYFNDQSDAEVARFYICILMPKYGIKLFNFTYKPQHIVFRQELPIYAVKALTSDQTKYWNSQIRRLLI